MESFDNNFLLSNDYSNYVQFTALKRLLINKGLITEVEYLEELISQFDSNIKSLQSLDSVDTHILDLMHNQRNLAHDLLLKKL